MEGVRGGVTNSELRLRVQSDGAARVLAFPFTQTVWLGRDATCDVVLASQEVSRRHLSLFVRDGALCVRDHSTYGTRVNGQPLQLAVRTVAAPALIQLGPYRVEVALSAGVLSVRTLAASRGMRALLHPRALLLGCGLMLCVAAWRYGRFVLGSEAGLPETPAADVPCPLPSHALAAESAASVLGAVQLLHAGDRLSALYAYRALATRDESRAEFSIVAELLARELSCQP